MRVRKTIIRRAITRDWFGRVTGRYVKHTQFWLHPTKGWRKEACSGWLRAAEAL